jgi:glycosidase
MTQVKFRRFYVLNLAIFFSFLSNLSQAQILSSTPIFANENDTITLIFDASYGNAALKNFNGDVFAHAGVITSKSTSSADWRYVQGTWGVSDAKVKMQSLGNNKYSLKYHIRTFYGLPIGETALKLAFVFRNQDGSIVGREADGSDIYYNLYSSGFSSKISSHTSSFIFAKLGDSILLSGASSLIADHSFIINGLVVQNKTGKSIDFKYGVSTSCVNLVILKSVEGVQTLYDTLYIVVPDLNNINIWPTGAEDGITYLSSSKIRFSLYAPGKQHVYVIGDFNNWTPSCTYQLNKTPDGKRFWLDISGFQPGKEYVFQYLVDGNLRIADPYSQVVLDPFNDGNISSTTYPNLKKYPQGKTFGIVTLIMPGKLPYVWKNNSFKRPTKTNLVIYELLIRDFIAARNFKTLKDSLGYFKRLGINCIELMPVSEFEGNNSWGYNVSYHSALDKAYGNIDDFKALIDECHEQGIAVVLDVVFNHAFSQNSLCQLYWDEANFRPATDNPWLNPIEKHPFNVGYDFNHESVATQYYLDKILKYWLQEFKVDGFRFDLSKGFTQKNTGSDVGAWGQYDQSRINLLNRMAKKLNAVDSTAFYILEHFADNSEETILSNNGFMFWGNLVYEYNQGTMGYASDLSWGNYKNRNWSNPNLVTYLESHDEERLMVKNTKFGKSNGSYSTKNLNTSLKRLELAGAFFFTIPGPKMFWQFGELGYDISIDQNGRTGEKPINWQYQANNNRKNLQNVWSDLIHLRTELPVFQTTDFTSNLTSLNKSIYLNSPDMKIAVLGNFDIISSKVVANFQQTGTWYEFFTGDSITISNTQQTFTFSAGEYRLYSTSRLNRLHKTLSLKSAETSDISVYPNPAQNELFIDLGNLNSKNVQLGLIDNLGRVVLEMKSSNRLFKIDLPELPTGIYTLKIQTENETFFKKCYIGQ